MFKNYIKTALRNLRKHKSFSLINILGLSVGICACLFIGMYILDELSYDQFHQHSDRIYRIYWESENSQTRTPHPMTYEMVKDWPEVENAVSLSPLWGPGLTRPSLDVRYKDKRFEEYGFLSADSTFFEVFPFSVVEGDPNKTMREPNQLVITESIAQKYFGNESALGKLLRINNNRDYQIGAVIEDVPSQSHFHFDFMVSYVSLKPRETGVYYEWADFGHYNYYLLSEQADPKDIEARIPQWVLKFVDWSDADKESFLAGNYVFRLQKLTDIHLHSNLKWELEPNSNVGYVYIFLAVGIFILFIACINYVNLTTARAMERGKEIGLRKTLGAERGQIISQFLGESLVYFMIAIGIALVLVDLLMPWFNDLTLKQLSFDAFGNGRVLLLIGGILLTVILGAGTYPAIFLSSFRPVEVLKRKFLNRNDGSFLRKGLVIFQFVVSTLMIASTIVIYHQLNFLQNADLGFENEQMMVMRMKSPAIWEKTEEVKAELKKLPEISEVTNVSNVPGGWFNQQPVSWKRNEENVTVSVVSVDHDYFQTLGIEIKEGQSFFPMREGDSTIYFMLNEAAEKLFDWENPVGESLYYYGEDQVYKGQILGITKDYHFESLHRTIAPLVFVMAPNDFNYMMVKIQSNNLKKTVASVEQIWGKFDQQSIFEYSFLNQDIESLYATEARMGVVMGLFSGLAIFIACMGLFALVAFVTEQRTKEIGIRKVLGASSKHLAWILANDLLKLIAIAFLISIPMTIFFMDQWLTQFPYRTGISATTFIYTAALLMIITGLTLGYHIFKAVSENPIVALRDE